MHLKSLFTLATAALLLCSCQGIVHGEGETAGDTIPMKYAKLLRMIDCDGYTKVEISNAWKPGTLLHTYLLTEDKTNIPPHAEGTVIQIPLSASAVYAGVHCKLIDELGAFHRISSVCDIDYIMMPKVIDAIRKGSITDLGSSMEPDIERLIQQSPGAILLSPFENSGGYGRIEQLGIPIVECADYMESGPLARAEWVKFYGKLYGKDSEADSIFSAVDAEYTSLKTQAKQYASRPTVITDMITGSTWYVPGGQSTIGQIISDAGGDYVFGNRNAAGSLALSPETVFDAGQDADIWLIRYSQEQDKTYQSLAADSPMYGMMQAFKQQRVYGCNLSYTPFFDDTAFHPERLLRELRMIFHPEESDNSTEQRYFKPL